jgi:Beta/Gamma crystallin
MKDNQHEQLFTEFTVDEFEATPTFQELGDEVAATCSGGVQRDIYFGGPDPDVILYDSPNLRSSGGTLHINAKALGGDDNLDNSAIGSGWNNKTSSIEVIRGEWLLYKDGGQKGTPVKLKPGKYRNAKAFGLPDNSLTGIFRTEV